MSSQDYYGERPPPPASYNSGYGSYGQQQYHQPPQYDGQSEYGQPPYHQSGDNYSAPPPAQSYGETLSASQPQYGHNPRPHSPYEEGYSRPTPPPAQYSEGYGSHQQNYSPQPPRQGYPAPQQSYGEQRGDDYQSGQYQGEYPQSNYSSYPPQGLPHEGYSQPPQSHEGYPPQGPPPGYPGATPEEGERGFLGALAGGAAGAYGGHKMHHGVLGGIGGAVAGSMLQDHFSDKKDEKKHQQQQQQQMQHHGVPIPPSGHQQNFRGNFSASSTQMSLDRDYDLIASCTDRHGQKRLSSVSLNACLSNEFGKFKWAKGGNFGGSARDVRLVEGGRVLEAELAAGDGSWRRARVQLDEGVGNEDGELKYVL